MSELDINRRISDNERRAERLRKSDAGTLAGSAFPTGISSGFVFFRTDIGFLCYYDGSQWLTVHEYVAAFGIGSGSYATNYSGAVTDARRAMVRNNYQTYLTYAEIQITTGATNNGTNYLTYNFVDSGSTTNWTVNTSADSAGVTVIKATSSFTQPVAAISSIRMDIAVGAGAPSAQFPYTPVVFYRLIVT